MRIVVTGATGFVGGRLCGRLRERGDTVIAVTRDPDAARASLGAGVEALGLPADVAGWAAVLARSDGVVNLAGASIASRWTAAHRGTIVSSRVDLTRSLVEGLAAVDAAERPPVLVSASAVGYYGTSENREFVEEDAAGSDFLATVCKDWEAAGFAAGDLGARVVLLRLGLVLGSGGALPRMMTPFRLFMGGPVAGGRQWMSWIHLEDAVGILLFALDHEISGALNAVAPAPVTNAEFSRTLAGVLHRPCWLPVPGFALRILMGRMSTIVTKGQRVCASKAKAAGYVFQHPELESALHSILDQ